MFIYKLKYFNEIAKLAIRFQAVVIQACEYVPSILCRQYISSSKKIPKNYKTSLKKKGIFCMKK